jgi:hypothetical protein
VDTILFDTKKKIVTHFSFINDGNNKASFQHFFLANTHIKRGKKGNRKLNNRYTMLTYYFIVQDFQREYEWDNFFDVSFFYPTQQ